MQGQNHFAEPKGHSLTFIHPNLLCKVTTEHCWECSNTFPIKTKNLQSDCITSSTCRHIDVTQPGLVSGGYEKWKPDNKKLLKIQKHGSQKVK
jgi:hypothetical protein